MTGNIKKKKKKKLSEKHSRQARRKKKGIEGEGKKETRKKQGQAEWKRNSSLRREMESLCRGHKRSRKWCCLPWGAISLGCATAPTSSDILVWWNSQWLLEKPSTTILPQMGQSRDSPPEVDVYTSDQAWMVSLRSQFPRHTETHKQSPSMSELVSGLPVKKVTLSGSSLLSPDLSLS